MSAFWDGFYKQADVGSSGNFFGGVGKGNLPTGTAEQGLLQGPVGGDGNDDTKVDMTLLDRQRNPKDFGVGNKGEDGPADSNPHIIY